jgi:uncharacterized protein YgiM (DUF1202 family)
VDILVTRKVTDPKEAEVRTAVAKVEKKGEAEARAKGTSRFVSAKTTINIRRGPGTNHSVIRQATKGERLAYISLEGDWYKLKVTEGKPQEWARRSVVVPEKPKS